jgi:CheY-like chemotaxis protein
MRFNILIVDDSHESRKRSYDAFVKKCVVELGVEIRHHIVRKPNELPRVLRSQRVDAVILDAVLNEVAGWEDFSSVEALSHIGSKIPIALISGRWDKTNSAQLTEVFKSPNCRTFMHWRDIDLDGGSGQIDYAVRSFGKLLSESTKLDLGIRLEEDESIWILHLSDVQAGGFDDKSLRLETRRCAEAVIARTGKSGPTFIAFTGDVAEYGDPAQYIGAKRWIEYFVKQLGWSPLPTRRILYVPGNHDVNISLAAASRLKFDKPKAKGKAAPSAGRFSLGAEVVQPELVRYGLAPYEKFHEEICVRDEVAASSKGLTAAWVEGAYQHLGVVFYGVNTAHPIVPTGLPGRSVDPNALADISEQLGDLVSPSEGRKPIVIGLGHHCPISASDDSAVSNPTDFKTFFGGAVPTALFLHGHIHEHSLEDSSSPIRLVRSCATTMTKQSWSRPEDSLRGFNLLELRRLNGEIVGLSGYCYSWLSSTLHEIKQASWSWDGSGTFRVTES